MITRLGELFGFDMNGHQDNEHRYQRLLQRTERNERLMGIFHHEDVDDEDDEPKSDDQSASAARS